MAANRATIVLAQKALVLFFNSIALRPYNKMLINSGGCAVFADMLAQLLEKNGIRDFKFRVWPDKHKDAGNRINLDHIDTSCFDYSIVDNWIKNHDVYFNHIAMEWRGSIWDAEGVKPSNGDTLYQGNLPYLGEIEWNVVSKSSKEEWQWNRAFNRKNIPKIRRVASDCFKKFGLRG